MDLIFQKQMFLECTHILEFLVAWGKHKAFLTKKRTECFGLLENRGMDVTAWLARCLTNVLLKSRGMAGLRVCSKGAWTDFSLSLCFHLCCFHGRVVRLKQNSQPTTRQAHSNSILSAGVFSSTQFKIKPHLPHLILDPCFHFLHGVYHHWYSKYLGNAFFSSVTRTQAPWEGHLLFVFTTKSPAPEIALHTVSAQEILI